MNRIEAVILGLLAAAAPACATGGGMGGHDPCRERGGNPPTIAQRVAMLQPSDCIGATPASQPAAGEDAGVAQLTEEETRAAIARCEVDCRSVCTAQFGDGVQSCQRRPDRLTVDCVAMMPGHPCGRLVAGVDRESLSSGEMLVQMHALEAVSAHAFEHLARELARFDAPSSLLARAIEASVEEERHAALVGALATARGMSLRAPTVTPPVARALVEIAVENAVEGCVRETWGALVALRGRQSEPDPELRAVYDAIADDELRHAAWSWDLDAWVRTKLSASELDRVQCARERAASALVDELSRSADGATAALARSLFDATAEA